MTRMITSLLAEGFLVKNDKSFHTNCLNLTYMKLPQYPQQF